MLAAKSDPKKGKKVTKVKKAVSKLAKNTKKKEAHRQERKKAVKKQEQNAIKAEESEQFEIVKDILSNDKFVDFISTNVGRQAIEVMKRLDKHKTDDALAAEMGVKVNEVRRVLNLLGGYGITKYDTNKDDKGWLTFSWYIDTDKLKEFANSLQADKQVDQSAILPDDCDDFFVCETCYKTDKVILPFDAAFEHSFKCPECGRPLKRLSKEEVKQLLMSQEAKI